MRNNSGGEDKIGAEIAGRFIQEKQLLYTVQGKVAGFRIRQSVWCEYYILNAKP
jgi:hypothetical protein